MVALYITLRDSTGTVIREMPDPFGGTFDASGDFEDLVSEAVAPLLSAIDAYSDTVLDSRDMPAIAAEVDELLSGLPSSAKQRQGRAGTAWRALTRFQVMVRLCQTDAGSTMHFGGD